MERVSYRREHDALCSNLGLIPTLVVGSNMLKLFRGHCTVPRRRRRRVVRKPFGRCQIIFGAGRRSLVGLRMGKGGLSSKSATSRCDSLEQGEMGLMIFLCRLPDQATSSHIEDSMRSHPIDKSSAVTYVEDLNRAAPCPCQPPKCFFRFETFPPNSKASIAADLQRNRDHIQL